MYGINCRVLKVFHWFYAKYLVRSFFRIIIIVICLWLDTSVELRDARMCKWNYDQRTASMKKCRLSIIVMEDEEERFFMIVLFMEGYTIYDSRVTARADEKWDERRCCFSYITIWHSVLESRRHTQEVFEELSSLNVGNIPRVLL